MDALLENEDVTLTLELRNPDVDGCCVSVDDALCMVLVGSIV